MPTFLTNNVNDISLAPIYVNTGTLKSYLQPGFIYKICLIPKGTKFTATQVAAMYTTLQSGIANNSDSARYYPIGNFIGMEDKSTEATIVTSATGKSTFVKDGQYMFVFEYDSGGMNFDIMLKKFQNAQDYFDVLFFDQSNNAVLGCTPAANTSSQVLQGYSLDLIYSLLPKWNDGNNPTTHKIAIALNDSDQITRRFAYKVLPDNQPLMELEGLRNLEFPLYSSISAGVAKTRVTTDGGAIDLYDLYAAALVTLTASWTFKDATNTTLTCTVSLDATTKTLVFTFSGAAYTALASGSVITCTTPTISQMTATIPGFGNNSFTLVKP